MRCAGPPANRCLCGELADGAPVDRVDSFFCWVVASVSLASTWAPPMKGYEPRFRQALGP